MQESTVWTPEEIEDMLAYEEQSVALTPEQEERERRYLDEAANMEMIAEMHNAQYCFD